MEEKIKKEITLNEILDAINKNNRESIMVQNFLFKMLESLVSQDKLLKEINKNMLESNKINNEIKRVIQLR